MSNYLYNIDLLPNFSAIQNENIKESILNILDNVKSKLNEILNQIDLQSITWDNSVEKIDNTVELLSRAWSIVSHLNNVVSNNKLRKSYNELLPIVSVFFTELSQNEKIYNIYKKLKESDSYTLLSESQKKAIDNALMDFKLSGIDLPTEKRKEYVKLETQLTELSSKFSNNVLDCTNEYYYHVEDVELLKGIPKSIIELTKQEAIKRKLNGYVITIHTPIYIPIMQYAENRELRETLHNAYVSKASNIGPHKNNYDNSEIIDRELSISLQIANILEFNNYAELSLAKKMAKSPQIVLDFLFDLVNKSKLQALKEFNEIKIFAEKYDNTKDIQPWDISFYSEKLKKELFDISDEDIKPYFPLPSVLKGLFKLCKEIFGITISPKIGVDVWHPDVNYYEVFNNEGILCGGFYTDLYSRENKRAGAWMDSCSDRHYSASGKIVLPIAYLITNFTPPIGKNPSLLTHYDVETLFHEFGHTLHHVLTAIDIKDVSGINGVPWDAVEVPSQFMENFTWNHKVLKMISSHVDTRESIPDTIIDKIINSKNFHSALAMIRQLEFAIFDFKLYYEYQQGTDVQKFISEIRNKVSVVPVSPFNKFQNSFSHIFAGGYSAGYYSYKWAEVLSADIFSKFEEFGIINKEIGLKYLNKILKNGGSKDFMFMFEDFMGRKPCIDALLRHYGIK
ncbi:MAG: M3 family metallopeptidase [Succinivibrionaceae bacterium]